MSPQGGNGNANGFDSSPKAGGQVGRNATLTPVTIKELCDATQTSPEESTFQICGAPLSQVLKSSHYGLTPLLNFGASVLCQVAILGAITRVVQKSTNTVYTVDDGTAQMDVMFWTTGEESEQQIKKKELWA